MSAIDYEPPMPRVPFLAILVAGGLVALALLTSFYPRTAIFLIVETERRHYEVGEIVNITATLLLGGNVPVTFITSPCPKVDFAVDRLGGDRVFDSYPDACPAGIVFLTLQPGERWSEHWTWNQVNYSEEQVPSGEYEILPLFEYPTSKVVPKVASSRIVIG